MRSVVMAILLAIAMDVAGQSCPGFAPATAFPAASTDPHSLVAADFNGDGNLDVATANASDDTVSILPGNGAGSLGAPVTFPTGDFPWSLVTADFNEDGAADLGVVTRGSFNFAILLGDGTGSFSAPVLFSTPAPPFGMATGDFNEDNNVDVAVATSGGVSIFAGTGTGSFGPSLDHIAGLTPWDIAVADLNGDDNLDLAVANSGSDDISILFGTGAGTFGLPANYSTGGDDPRAITSADFDGDGDADLAVVNEESETMAVFLNAGNGSFAPAAVYSTRAPGDVNPNETFPGSIVAAELTGDTIPDLAVTNFGRGNVVLVAGTGSATFTPQFPVPAFSLGADVAVIAADFDEDESVDLAVASILPGTVRILLNACGPAIPALSSLALIVLSALIAAIGLYKARP